MADNYVTLKIRATDDAKPDLDDLKLKLDELGHKVDTAKVKVDDEDAKLKLLDINARLAELNRKVANPKIKVAGAARAQFEAEKLSLEMDKLKAKADSMGGGSKFGKLGSIGSMLFGIGGEGASDGGGGIMDAIKSIAMSPAGLPAIGIAIGALLTEATGLISGFAAAGAGVGAFAALAMPAFDKIKTAYTQINAAQLAYNQATTAAGRATALAHLKDAWAALDPAERGALKGIDDLRASFDKMSKAFQPAAFKVFNEALQIANRLLPQLAPFANVAARAIEGLLKQFDGFLKGGFSNGFQVWLDEFRKLSGPSITAIGEGFGKVAVALGKLLTVMSAKDVVNAINIAFSILSGTISALTGIVKFTMAAWDGWTHTFDQSRTVFDRMRHTVATDFDAIRHATAAMVHDLGSYLSEAKATVSRFASEVGSDLTRVVSFFEKLPGRVRGALSSLPGVLRAIGVNAIMGLVHGIESMAGAVETAVKHIAGLIPSALSHILSIFSPSRVTFWHGQMSGQGVVDGLLSMEGKVEAAARRLGRAAGLTTGGGMAGGTFGGGGMAGGGGTLRLEFTGGDGEISEALVKFMRNYIRVTGGGNVQQALGRG